MSELIRYEPPKSSLWGHRMGGQSPAAFRDGVAAFLGQAVRRHETAGCSIDVSLAFAAKPDEVPFVRAFNAGGPVTIDLEGHHFSAQMSGADFATCLNWFTAHHEELPGRSGPLHFALERRHRVCEWDFGDAADEDLPECELAECYGTIQRLGTRLAFWSLDEYRWVGEIARSTLGIRMNDRHVRPRNAITG